jgi:hypothetical protein
MVGIDKLQELAELIARSYIVSFYLLIKQDTHQQDYNHMKVVWLDWMIRP